MKSLADWLEFLESLHPKGQDGIELGLERVARVKEGLKGSPISRRLSRE
jgi:dihydrofolate synthase/folylpolyglutamate synthase